MTAHMVENGAAAAPAAANGAYLPKTSPRAVKKPARPPAISHTALRTYGTGKGRAYAVPHS